VGLLHGVLMAVVKTPLVYPTVEVLTLNQLLAKEGESANAVGWQLISQKITTL